ncbi:hypothetical protein A2U01_0058571, partial [Trifolium medium]|nr:hypothetical protein [Trifolium medium]
MDLMGQMLVEVIGEKGTTVVRIRSDHGRQFENAMFSE